MPKSYWSLLVLFLLSSLSFAEEDLRENKAYAQDDWRAYSQYDRTYTIEVLKKISHPRSKEISDIAWIYTQEFAERFRMPKRWIGSKDFKGALAVAYRYEINEIEKCGYFGSWDNCQDIRNECYYDIYVDHNNQDIPWNTQETYGTVYGNDSSRYFLRPFHYKDGVDRDIYSVTVLNMDRPMLTEQSYQDLRAYKGTDNDFATGVGIDLGNFLFYRKDNTDASGGFIDVRKFHRNVLEGIDLIVTRSFCEAATVDKGAGVKLRLGLRNLEGFIERRKRYHSQFSKAELKKFAKTRYVDYSYMDYKIYLDNAFVKRMIAFEKKHIKSRFLDYFRKNMSPPKKPKP